MQKKPFPSETQERFIVRLPDGMRDRIAEAAKAAGRSMNSEIVHRLQESFDENFVTVIEARAKPGPESKHFEFNADEIAEKVIEKLERKRKSEAKSQPQLDAVQMVSHVSLKNLLSEPTWSTRCMCFKVTLVGSRRQNPKRQRSSTEALCARPTPANPFPKSSP